MDTNNKTLYGLQRKGWQIFWLNIYVITIFSSIVGNSIILVASIKFKAIKLDKVMFYFCCSTIHCRVRQIKAGNFTDRTLSPFILFLLIFKYRAGFE